MPLRKLLLGEKKDLYCQFLLKGFVGNLNFLQSFHRPYIEYGTIEELGNKEL